MVMVRCVVVRRTGCRAYVFLFLQVARCPPVMLKAGLNDFFLKISYDVNAVASSGSKTVFKRLGTSREIQPDGTTR
jgi:hypothetical protein